MLHNIKFFERRFPETAKKLMPKLWAFSIGGIAIGMGLLMLA